MKTLNMLRPCLECPWRLERAACQFPVERFQALADTVDNNWHPLRPNAMFACHKSEEGSDLVCAGYLLVDGMVNTTVRLNVKRGVIDMRRLRTDALLHSSFAEMAIKNGVTEEWLRERFGHDFHRPGRRLRPFIVVGEVNPYGDRPGMELYPWPKNSAGERLVRVVLDTSPEEYLRRATRFNLLRAGETLDANRAAVINRVVDIEQTALKRGHPVVLLGASVARAFSVASGTHAGTLHNGVVFVALPHPSGRCRAWNKPGQKELARKLLTAAKVYARARRQE